MLAQPPHLLCLGSFRSWIWSRWRFSPSLPLNSLLMSSFFFSSCLMRISVSDGPSPTGPALAGFKGSSSCGELSGSVCFALRLPLRSAFLLAACCLKDSVSTGKVLVLISFSWFLNSPGM